MICSSLGGQAAVALLEQPNEVALQSNKSLGGHGAQGNIHRRTSSSDFDTLIFLPFGWCPHLFFDLVRRLIRLAWGIPQVSQILLLLGIAAPTTSAISQHGLRAAVSAMLDYEQSGALSFRLVLFGKPARKRGTRVSWKGSESTISPSVLHLGGSWRSFANASGLTSRADGAVVSLASGVVGGYSGPSHGTPCLA